MAVTFAAIRRGLDDLKLKYMEIDSTTLGLVQVGEHARIAIVVELIENGEYVRMRTIGLATCPREHFRFANVMTAVAAANHEYSVVRFAWDKSDGEITGDVSLPLEDNASVTVSQVRTLYGLLFVSCDQVFAKLEALLGPQERTSLSGSPSRAVRSAASPAAAMVSAASSGPKLLHWALFLIGLAALGGVAWLFLH